MLATTSLLLSLAAVSTVFCDVIFTTERCTRPEYGLQAVHGDPTKYKQCGPSGKVWIVPCAPNMTFDPLDKVCKERSIRMSLLRRTQHAKTRTTVPSTTPSAAPEEFVFSTLKPRKPRIKGKGKGKIRKTSTVSPPTTTMMLSSEYDTASTQVTSVITPIYASSETKITNIPTQYKPNATTATRILMTTTTMRPPAINTLNFGGEKVSEDEFMSRLMKMVKAQKTANEEKEREERLERQRQEEEARNQLERERLQREKEARVAEQLRIREIEKKRKEAERRAEQARITEEIRVEEERKIEVRRLEEERMDIERKRKELEEEKIRMDERRRVELVAKRRLEMEMAQRTAEMMERQRLDQEEKKKKSREIEQKKVKEAEEARLKALEEARIRELERKKLEEAERKRLERQRLEQEREEMKAMIEKEEKQKQMFNRLGSETTVVPQHPMFPQTKLPDDLKIIRFPPGPGDRHPAATTAVTVPPLDTWGVIGGQSWKNTGQWNNIEEYFETTTMVTPVYSGCIVNGDCPYTYEKDQFCRHPDNPSAYLQCSPLIGRRGRWTERYCPDTLIFIEELARCEKQIVPPREFSSLVSSQQSVPYNPEDRVFIPRLPSEMETVEWTGNRVQTIPQLPEYPTMRPVDVPQTYTSTPIYPTIIPQFTNDIVPTTEDPNELDLQFVSPIFPRFNPSFLDHFLPFKPLRDDRDHTQTLIGSVVKPVIKKIALSQTSNFIDRLLSDEASHLELGKENLKSEGDHHKR